MFAVLFTSCSDNNSSLDSAVVGVVETSRWNTRVSYYDSDDTLLKTKKVFLPMVGYITHPAVCTDGKAFAVSGIGEFYANSKVIMSDTTSNGIKKLKISESAVFSMHAQGDAVFCIGGLTSDLIRFDIKTQEELTFNPEDYNGNFVYAFDDTVYFVADNGQESVLYLLDEETLAVKKQYNTTKYFYAVEDMQFFDGKLYIAAFTKIDNNGMEAYNSDLVCFDAENETFDVIEIESDEPCKSLAASGEYLVLSSGDSRTSEKQHLTVINSNKSEVHTKEVDFLIDQVECKGDKLYCLSEEDKLVVFDLTDSELPILKEVDVSTKEGFGVSAFFLI